MKLGEIELEGEEITTVRQIAAARLQATWPVKPTKEGWETDENRLGVLHRELTETLAAAETLMGLLPRDTLTTPLVTNPT